MIASKYWDAYYEIPNPQHGLHMIISALKTCKFQMNLKLLKKLELWARRETALSLHCLCTRSTIANSYINGGRGTTIFCEVPRQVFGKGGYMSLPVYFRRDRWICRGRVVPVRLFTKVTFFSLGWGGQWKPERTGVMRATREWWENKGKGRARRKHERL